MDRVLTAGSLVELLVERRELAFGTGQWVAVWAIEQSVATDMYLDQLPQPVVQLHPQQQQRHKHGPRVAAEQWCLAQGLTVVMVATGVGNAARNGTVSWALPPPSACRVAWLAEAVRRAVQPAVPVPLLQAVEQAAHNKHEQRAVRFVARVAGGQPGVSAAARRRIAALMAEPSSEAVEQLVQWKSPPPVSLPLHRQHPKLIRTLLQLHQMDVPAVANPSRRRGDRRSVVTLRQLAEKLAEGADKSVSVTTVWRLRQPGSKVALGTRIGRRQSSKVSDSLDSHWANALVRDTRQLLGRLGGVIIAEDDKAYVETGGAAVQAQRRVSNPVTLPSHNFRPQATRIYPAAALLLSQETARCRRLAMAGHEVTNNSGFASYMYFDRFRPRRCCTWQRCFTASNSGRSATEYCRGCERWAA